MITAVEEARLARRHRPQSAGSGAQFSVPALPDVPTMLPLATSFASPSAGAACPQVAPAPSPQLSEFLGRSVGSGQCVALVRAALPSLGPSSTWTEGAAVQGNTSLAPGTPIATFGAASTYANATDGSSHAALYLGQDAQGLKVLDQWQGRAAAVRTIPWNHPGASAANTGSAFHVVQAANA